MDKGMFFKTFSYFEIQLNNVKLYNKTIKVCPQNL